MTDVYGTHLTSLHVNGQINIHAVVFHLHPYMVPKLGDLPQCSQLPESSRSSWCYR